MCSKYLNLITVSKVVSFMNLFLITSHVLEVGSKMKILEVSNWSR